MNLLTIKSSPQTPQGLSTCPPKPQLPPLPPPPQKTHKKNVLVLLHGFAHCPHPQREESRRYTSNNLESPDDANATSERPLWISDPCIVTVGLFLSTWRKGERYCGQRYKVKN